ncbi:LirA/MavJ family T4SS effector [Legionella jamestowniensis]|uniref:Helicase n=1 Tax=Legionella jamestowniensis TaxID=455 RepID=A0A0W0ULE7_9GAMM|nr:LirA/MavJ family T4SS effector [Legionella jamestowniensis]KTD08591.1 helicase [Legionella jamestowniensis]OCH96957.1 hypothetical protein A8135_04790 [Legionella jamestowniensis]SFL53308.1 hypothetical protein SAMN02746073_0735 [Legionella jamestowniensis DSM 19215]
MAIEAIKEDNDTSKQFLTGCYLQYPQSYLKDYERIRIKIGEVANTHLLELEKKLQEFSKKHGKKHLLTSFFLSYFQDNGFNQGGEAFCIDKSQEQETRKLVNLPSCLPEVYGLLPDSSFAGILISQGYMFKDPGADVAHGEFSHLFQLYVIMEEHKQRPFLENNPVDLLRVSASLRNDHDFTPWIYIFDLTRPDFSSPIYWNTELLKISEQYFKNADLTMRIDSTLPLIHELLTKRANKRNPDFIDNPVFNQESINKPGFFSKYHIRNGLVLDDAVYLKDNLPMRKMEFDDVISEYEPLLRWLPIVASPTPCNTQISLLEQLYSLFPPSKLPPGLRARDPFNSIHDELLKLEPPKNGVLKHRKIMELLVNSLSKLPIRKENEKFAMALTTGIKLIINHDIQLKQQNQHIVQPTSSFKPLDY